MVCIRILTPLGETYRKLWKALQRRVVIVVIVVTTITNIHADCRKLPAGTDLFNAHNPSEKRGPSPTFHRRED